MIEINIANEAKDPRNLLYGFGDCEFGFIFLVMDDCETIHYLSFKSSKTITSEMNDLKEYWPMAEFSENSDKVSEKVKRIFDRNHTQPVAVKLTGTDFQVTVWKALMCVNEGSTVCYEDIAKAIGKPRAVRAVASAVGSNKIAYLIPCHRVISKNGGLGGYRWGTHRKLRLLAFERAT